MIFLGVDCGGTKSSYVLADEKGGILGRYKGEGGTFLSLGAEGLSRIIEPGISRVCEISGIYRESISYAGFGFPGYGEGEDSDIVLKDMCCRILGHDRIICECDSYLGWAGSLGMEPGINIVSGTGSICFGVNEDGLTARTSGWGAYCDEGSCRWIGSKLLECFTKQADGRMEKTLLYEMFRKHFNITEDLYFIHDMNHVIASSGSETAKLQVLLKEIYEAGDLHAKRIYEEAASELWLAIKTTAIKLRFKNLPYKVSYSGGLFKSGSCITEPLDRYVRQGGGLLTEPRYEPDMGAVLMAARKNTEGRK